MGLPFTLPQGWPWSLWFLIATAILYLLQRFPYTGIFLMIVAAPFWSVILVNLGAVGIGLEALTGRVSRLWLILPLAYFGGYYLLAARERAAFVQLRAEVAKFNAGKAMPFDEDRQDLVIEKVKGDFHPSAAGLVQRYALRRAFEGNNVYLIGDAEACELVRKSDIYRSAGIHATASMAPAATESGGWTRDIARSALRLSPTSRSYGC